MTFVMQKEMSKVEGFEEWYAPWQAAMARTPVLKWLVQARNQIVKEGDLATESMTRARIVFNYFDAAAIAQERSHELALAPLDLKAEVLATIDEIRDNVLDQNLPQWMLEDAIVVLERRWVAEGFPSSELLNALGYAFSFLRSLVIDADVQFSAAPYDPDLDPETIGTDKSTYPSAVRPPCMVSTHEARTVSFRYLDGDGDVGGINWVLDPGPPDLALLEQAIEKFGPLRRSPGARTALDHVEQSALIAESILASGENHGWFHIYFRGARAIHREILAARDKADKYVLAQQVVQTALRLGADGVLQIGEVWIGRAPAPGEEYIAADKQPDRSEAVQVYAEIASGETRGIIVPFKRSPFGIVEVGERFDENTPSNFLLPLRMAWASDRPSETQPERS